MGQQLDLIDYIERRDAERRGKPAPALDGKRGRAFAAKRSAELNAHGDRVEAGDECTWKHCPIHGADPVEGQRRPWGSAFGPRKCR